MPSKDDFVVWGKQKSTARFDDKPISGPIGGYNPNAKPWAPEPAKPRQQIEEAPVPAPNPANSEPEVKLSNPRFIVPSEGVGYNGYCEIAVDLAFLKKTIRKRVSFELHAVYDNDDEIVANNLTGEESRGTAVTKARLYYHSKNRDDGSSEYYFTASHSKGAKRVESPRLTVPCEGKIVCDFVEVPDILFHHESAVPCIDSGGFLIGSLVAARKFVHENPEKEIVLFGHTEMSGSDEYNFELSADRSAAIKALLDNDEAAWAAITKNRSKPVDYQQILKTLGDKHGWPCDPGAVDGKPGPKTKAAIEAFQREYNSRFDGGLVIDGTIGQKTWSALFVVTRAILETETKKAIGSDTLPILTYGYEGKGLYSCGESFPLEGILSTDARNRRVEICFFDKGKAPKLLEHKDRAAKVTTTENPVYDRNRTERRPIQFEAMEIRPKAQSIVIPWLFDCHMHINSGHCAPLPLSRSKVPLPFMNQQRLDWLGQKALGDFGELQKLSTNEIGDAAVMASEPVMHEPELQILGEVGKRRRLLISMPMDMDRAHYWGYEGRMIYENVNGRTMWWNEKNGRYESVPLKDEAMWERYKMQLERTASAFYANNGALVSFYNYDPRARLTNWRLPFDKNLVQTASPSSFPKNLPAIGIKMYTALGYRPLDQKLNFPWHEYYGLCAARQIPIVCHGSRGGMTTHDILTYYEREYPRSANIADSFKQAWFTDKFVSPYAWEPVLQKHPTLTLCLAHFGGDTFWDRKANPYCDAFWKDLKDRDEKNWIAGFLHLMRTYPNVYVDLSYFLFEPTVVEYFKKALAFDPVVKERILFGTDWWMFTMAGQYKSGGYLKYVQNMCNRILSITDQSLFRQVGIENSRELLAYFMVINPMRFLQIKKHVGKLSAAFYKDDLVIKRKAKFALEEWINDVPDSIEDFYK